MPHAAARGCETRDAMRVLTRSRTRAALPGPTGTLRVGRQARGLVRRLQPGDVAVIDESDLDRATAQALVDAGVVAVVDASPLLSGRYPALGPEVLAAQGVTLVESVGATGLAALRDGARVRVHGDAVWIADRVLAAGRARDLDDVHGDMEAARSGLARQLEVFTHGSVEFLRREQDLLLHGEGLPALATRIAGRPVVVVADGPDRATQLAALRPFVREQDPVLIGVERGADALAAAGLRPHVLVVGPSEEDIPGASLVRSAGDVVLRTEAGRGRVGAELLERLKVRPHRVDTAAAAEDLALLLAHHHEASVIVGVGLHLGLDDVLDRRRAGSAGAFLTRLRVGSRLVDAAAVPTLYSGRVRPRHLWGVAVAGLLALGVAVATTPVGQEWGAELGEAAGQVLGPPYRAVDDRVGLLP